MRHCLDFISLANCSCTTSVAAVSDMVTTSAACAFKMSAYVCDLLAIHVGLVMQSRISLQKLLGPGWPASPYLTAAPKDGLQVDIATWFAGKSPHGTPMACTKDK